MAKKTPEGPSGLVVIDKPAGMTSHDVVSRMRRLAGTRRVGHAGTLDPMATGVLILGINKATKLLTWVVGESKTYTTTIRLGIGTITDDAEGEVKSVADSAVVEKITEQDIQDACKQLTGDIMQVPSSVSAIKVNGVRSYARVRSGEEVKLEARPITVHEFTIDSVEQKTVDSPVHLVDSTGNPVDSVNLPSQVSVRDVRATISCSSGTYIRALARDLGAALGVSAHLTELRRTRIGEVDVTHAATLEQLQFLKDQAPEQSLPMLSLEDAARKLFGSRQLSAVEATDISNGRRVTPTADENVAKDATLTSKHASTAGISAAFAPDGTLVALIENKKWRGHLVAAPVLVFESGKTFGETS